MIGFTIRDAIATLLKRQWLLGEAQRPTQCTEQGPEVSGLMCWRGLVLSRLQQVICCGQPLNLLAKLTAIRFSDHHCHLNKTHLSD